MSEGRTRLFLRVLKKGRAEYREFWTGDENLPFQGWFGELAARHPGVATALLASLSANIAWLLFSLGEMFESPLAKMFTRAFAWFCVVFAALLAGGFIVAVIWTSIRWLRNNLRSARADDLDNDETKKKGA